MLLTKLNQELGKSIDSFLLKELIDEYTKLRTCHWIGDVTKTIIHGGRFSEICIACLVKLADGSVNIDFNKIEFGILFEKLQKIPKPTSKEELLFMIIPQVLKGVYTIRSKKRVAHIKSTNADNIDGEYVTTASNWIISQLILLYYTSNPNDATTITNSLMEKRVPTIEQFDDGEIMILKKGLTFGDELLLILYQFSKRMSTNELDKILKPKKRSYINTYLNNLYTNKLIHLNKEGAIINKNGIIEIEKNKEKYFE